jgi:hypothetical protein
VRIGEILRLTCWWHGDSLNRHFVKKCVPTMGKGGTEE